MPTIILKNNITITSTALGLLNNISMLAQKIDKVYCSSWFISTFVYSVALHLKNFIIFEV